MTVAEVREDLGSFAAWRQEKDVAEFFEDVNEQSFYRGLGGLAARHLGEVTEVQRDAGVANVDADDDRADEELQDGIHKNLALNDAYRFVLDELKDPVAFAAVLRGQEAAQSNKMLIKQHAKAHDRNVAKRLIAESKTVNPLADEKYIRPKTRIQRKVEDKVVKLLKQIKSNETVAKKFDRDLYFLNMVVNKVEVTPSFLRGEKSKWQGKLDRGEITPFEFEEVIHELEHLKGHSKAHPLYKRRESYTPKWFADQQKALKTRLDDPEDEMDIFAYEREMHELQKLRSNGNVAPAKRHITARDKAENARIELNRLFSKYLAPEEELERKLAKKTAKRYGKGAKAEEKKANRHADEAWRLDEKADFEVDLARATASRLEGEESADLSRDLAIKEVGKRARRRLWFNRASSAKATRAKFPINRARVNEEAIVRHDADKLRGRGPELRSKATEQRRKQNKRSTQGNKLRRKQQAIKDRFNI